MTHHRKEFLQTLFRMLEQEQVRYCVLRNYAHLYEDAGSDVDLAVQRVDLRRMKECLERAAAATNYRLVLSTRYVNFSYVFSHPDGFFIRIDAETELRWRFFPILQAKSIVDLRRREADFYIPHPRHESAILLAAAIWRGCLSERYRQQLASLYLQAGSPEELRLSYLAAFGRVGGELASWQGKILQQTPRLGLWKEAWRSIILNAFHDGPNRRAMLSYLTTDVARFFERLRRPPGISLLYACQEPADRQMDELLARLEVPFPASKAMVQLMEPSTASLGPKLWLRRLRTVFKGGLFVAACGAESDRELQQVSRRYSPLLYPSRGFLCVVNSRSGICLGHVGTGYMAEFDSAKGAPDSSEPIVRFISAILEKQQPTDAPRSRRRGAFVVLVGPDGSGKTTVARRICCEPEVQEQFRRIQYFHWRPKLVPETVFPLPQLQEVPRKPQLQGSLLQSCLSMGRLIKNLVLTNLAHALRVAPLLRRNTLVLADRYFYNYYLDPVSVKYYGPKWLLDRLRPLFPRPDMVVVLKAPADVLRARKQELSREEIIHQNELLAQLPLDGVQRFEVDTSQPAGEVSRRIVQRLTEMSA